MKNTMLKLITLLVLITVSVGMRAQNDNNYPAGAKAAIPAPKPGSTMLMGHAYIPWAAIPAPKPGSTMMMGHIYVPWDIFDEEPPITGDKTVFGGAIEPNIAKLQKNLQKAKDAINTFTDNFNDWYKKANAKLATLTPKDLKKFRELKNELRDWWELNLGTFMLKLMNALGQRTVYLELDQLQEGRAMQAPAQKIAPAQRAISAVPQNDDGE